MDTHLHHPHPGAILREDVLPALGLTVTEAAAQLDVTRATLSRVLNGRAAVSPEMALRIEAWLGRDRGGDAGLWLRMQANFDRHAAELRLRDHPLRVMRAPEAVPA
ncbi:HigA family addiction module antitoxin [Aquariibacter albus]|uniref:HigA family addiction module antidote protein n=1 Tax=Aquariibacter albus TaxID=2759899 RepID=A0A839HR21_9BURK|nr:HigA family addiction module antitoxin [Aquariibacter albus]MBB1161491.1 HigA family addiction module antidote protein [Aquariibacter albus]